MLSAFALAAIVPTSFFAAAMLHGDVPDGETATRSSAERSASPRDEDRNTDDDGRDEPRGAESGTAKAPSAVLPNNAPLSVPSTKPARSIPPEAPLFAEQIRDHLKKGAIRRAADDIIARVTANPELLNHREVRDFVVDVAGRVALISNETNAAYFKMLSERAGTQGIDVLYELVTQKGGSRAASLAESLLLTPDVLERGSKALRTAWQLRRARSCVDKKATFPLVLADGDHRSMAELIPLAKRCSRRGPPCCLHGDKDLDTLLKALRDKGV